MGLSPYSMTGGTILEVAYGIEIQPRNDPYIKIVKKAVEALTVGSTHRALVYDIFPICTITSFIFFCTVFS